MADTIRETIIKAIIAQVKTIKTSNGYNSNIGNNTLRAICKIDEESVPAIVIFPMQDTLELTQFGLFKITMPFSIEAHVKFGDMNSSEYAELIYGDMLKCVFNQTFISNLKSTTNLDAIMFESGGTDEFPEGHEKTISVKLVVNVKYRTNIGDPYS